ncbi:MAG: DUF4347 domain-containing protein, partial [Verrucomicrobiales bacterium]|nr:DUF4347 domain-containing protein [Verrucomicrobiales bacterium]
MASLHPRRRVRSEADLSSAPVHFEAVEPRVLFSATAIEPVDGGMTAHHDLPEMQEEVIVETLTGTADGADSGPHAAEDEILGGLNFRAADLDSRDSRELVFVSSGVFDDDYLARHLDPAYEVYLIEPGSDAIAQIAQVLEGRSGIEAIHLIGHGEEGRLFLGDTVLDASSMSGSHGALLAQIGSSLSDRADLLIYGCDFSSGADGETAASLLARLTGADVATSSDKTGHSALGGDWDLEVSTGEIEAATIAMADWRGLLAPPTITAPEGALSTLEDTPLTFSGSNLITVGSDESPSLTVVLSVGQGGLNLSGTSGITFLSGTQNGDALLQISGTIANLNAAINGLVFTPGQDFFGPETLSITVDDGDDVTSRDLSISVVSQNDAPVITVNPVNASGTGTPSETTPHTFTLADFEAVDPDNTNNQLTFILDVLPSAGELRLNGFPVAVGTVFTQAMLDAGALVYVHKGGETHSDSFTLTVNDGAGGTDALVVIPITITPVNDSMTVVTQAVVYEGGSTSDGAIAPGKPVPVLSLVISDAEADTKTVRITSLPGGGLLFFNGTQVTQAMVDGGFSFNAADSGLLEYRHDGIDDLGTSPSDRSFTIQVTDLGGGAGPGAVQTVNHTVNIDVVPVNDDLELINLSTAVPTISSGNSHVLGLADMEVNDPDGPNNQLTYTLQSSPLLGDLYINGQLSGAGATFTQAQLAAGQVVFTNGGANGPDSLFFTVTDSQVSILTDELGTLRTGDHTTPQRVLELRFNLTASGGGGAVIRLDEGQSATVNIAAPGETIELTSAPARGQILVNGMPLGVGVPYLVQPGDVILYAHDGSHNDSDMINLVVDGMPEMIDVVVRLTNDAPVLTILSTVNGIREGSTGTITTAHLSVTDEETTDPGQLIYTMIGSPSGGSLLKDGNRLPAFGTFSHQDVIDGRITYEHDGDERFLDSVQLRVSDGSATDTGTLSLEIVPVNDQPVVTASFLELMEGATKSFTAADLGISDVDGVGDDIGLSPDAPLQIRIDSLPAHGTLFYNDPVNGLTAVTAGFVFDHSEIGRLSYQHDGSENFDDDFDFTVIDNNTYNNPGFDAPGTRAGVMTIGIIPVNDAPAVTTNEGLVNDINGDRRVYEGGTRVLTPAVLESTDPDSTNEQVQYRITSAPINGTLLLNGSPIGVGSAFSQDDLIAGRVSYRHNGSETSADQFNFRIDDGSSNVAEETFLIGIIAVNDAPVIAAPASATVNTADYHFTGARAISIADNDAATGDVTVTLTVSDPGGLLRVINTTGLTSITGNDTSNVLVLVGDVSEINAALATLHYRATDLDGPATLTIHVNDGGNTGVDPSQVPVGEIPGLVDTGGITDEQATRVVNLLVSPIDDAPVNSIPGAQTAYEDVNFIFSNANGNAISIGDVDAFGQEVQVTLAVGNGTLTLATTSGLSFTTGDGTSDATMTFRGTIGAINAALDGLRYRGNNNFEGGEILTITTNDLGNTGDGGPLSDTDTVNMTVIGVNDAPVISGPSADILISSATFAFNGANTISVTDSDISSGLATVTLTVNDPGGILQLGNLTGLSAVSGNGTSNVLSFTGTVADVNNALASLTYSPDDVNGAATLTVVVSDNGNTGVDPSTIGQPHTGTTTDEQATRVFNLTVSDINDAPVNTVPGAQTFNEDTPRVFSTANGNAISIADVDAFGFDVTTTITVNNGTLTAGGTALQQAALTSLTGNGSNTLVLTGTVAEINAVL